MENSNDNLRDTIPQWFCLLPNELEYTDHLCSEGHGDRTKDPKENANFSYSAKYFCVNCNKGCLCMTCFKPHNPHHTHNKIRIYKASERPSLKVLDDKDKLIQPLLEPFYGALHELSTYSYNHHWHYFLAPPSDCKEAKKNACHTCRRKETRAAEFRYCSIKCLIDSSLPIPPTQSNHVPHVVVQKANLKGKKKKKNGGNESVTGLQIRPVVETSTIGREIKYLEFFQTLASKIEERIGGHDETHQQTVPTFGGDNRIVDEKEVLRNLSKAGELCRNAHRMQCQQLVSSAKSSEMCVESEVKKNDNQEQASPSEMQADTNNLQTLPSKMQVDTINLQTLPSEMQVDKNNLQTLPSEMQVDTNNLQTLPSEMQANKYDSQTSNMIKTFKLSISRILHEVGKGKRLLDDSKDKTSKIAKSKLYIKKQKLMSES